MKIDCATLSLSVCAFSFAFAFATTGCGVRGRPQAPLTPAELGRGEPGFKRASEEFAFPNIPAPTPTSQPKAREENR